MAKDSTTRRSHCALCGKRLSEKTKTGNIVWHAGHVDDSGIYCEQCQETRKPSKSRKSRK